MPSCGQFAARRQLGGNELMRGARAVVSIAREVREAARARVQFSEMPQACGRQTTDRGGSRCSCVGYARGISRATSDKKGALFSFGSLPRGSASAAAALPARKIASRTRPLQHTAIHLCRPRRALFVAREHRRRARVWYHSLVPLFFVTVFPFSRLGARVT